MKKQIELSHQATEHKPIFEHMLLTRSSEKFESGLRTTKIGWMPRAEWDALRANYGNDMLLSTYVGGMYTVITTPTHQYGFLTAELDAGDALVKYHEGNAKVFGTLIGGAE